MARLRLDEPFGYDMRILPGIDFDDRKSIALFNQGGRSGDTLIRTSGDNSFSAIGKNFQIDDIYKIPVSGMLEAFYFIIKDKDNFGNSTNTTIYKLSEMNYDWARSVQTVGYEYSGNILYGHSALMAAFMEGDDQITGSNGADYLLGYGGNDRFIQGNGADIFDGGLGIDVVSFSSRSSDKHLISKSDSGFNVQYKHLANLAPSQYDVMYQTISVERFEFRDKSIAFDLDPGGNAGWAARIIGVLVGKDALANKALAGEVISYVDTYGIQTVTELLVSLGVTSSLAGGSDNASFFTLLYKNVVGAPPPAAELTELVGYVESGAFTQAQALQVIAGLGLTADQIGLTGLAQKGWDFFEYEI